MASPLPLFFSAFEPSGDRLAAALIAEIKRREPERAIYAYGGPMMEAAGALLLERTTDHAVMLLDAAREFLNHRRRVARLKAWFKTHPISAFIPVDSPAAHWVMCKAVRAGCPSAKVIHLVCPQVWAWAPWRVNWLKKLTDRVLCLLPSEVDFLKQHAIAASFVGHPIFEEVKTAPPPAPPGTFPEAASGAPRIAILAGSRKKEVLRNLQTFAEVFRQVRMKHPGAVGVLCMRREADAQWMNEAAGGAALPEGLPAISGLTPQAWKWCDAALVKSGTSTLEAAAHRVPLVMMFNVVPWQWFIASRTVIKTRTFGLPNLIGQSLGLGPVCPEFCPHVGDPAPVAAAFLPLLVKDSPERLGQLRKFDAIAAAFAGKHFAQDGADALLDELRNA